MLPDLDELRASTDELHGVELLMMLAGPGGPLCGRAALVSSFGAESAVLLHMAASVDPALPVIFIDTGKHFPETLAYRDLLVRHLGLRDVRVARPDRLTLLQNDRHGRLFAEDPDLCCHIRKTETLETELRGFAAWITGRKRSQGGLRADLETIEVEPSTGRLKLNPLAAWPAGRLEAYQVAHALPAHPLVARSYRSIGCAPCTRPTAPGESPRAGRWSGLDKTECGIHLPWVDRAGRSGNTGGEPMSAASHPPRALRESGPPRWRGGQSTEAADAMLSAGAAPLGPGPSTPRDEILRLLFGRLGDLDGRDAMSPGMPPARAVEEVVPDSGLRPLLLADASLAALLPGFRGSVTAGAAALFTIGPAATVSLHPSLTESPGALVAAARWALEVAEAEAFPSGSRCGRAVAALEHGAALVEELDDPERQILLALLPTAVRQHLGAEPPSRVATLPDAIRGLLRLVAAPWAGELAAELDAAAVGPARAAVAGLLELALPLERALVAGGDTRLRVDPARGLNRYGTAPRPRPEAVHFSSSTASSISDYGFRLCDALRRRLLWRGLAQGIPASALWADLAEHARREIGATLGLAPDQADVVLAASGTDTELLAVLLALAADGGRPLTNVLIAPEETGRGVALAGGGRFFDDATAAGLAARKGEPAWPERRVETRSVAIRDDAGRVRPTEGIGAEVRQRVADALAAGHRVLVHVLLGSKTGISAPPLEFVEGLRRLDGERVDVVVDACQLRVTPSLLGALVRRGWMVQVSGSKFLTGPAFSGALVVPTAMRDRRNAAAELLAAAPAAGRPEDWPREWRAASAAGGTTPSFGMPFRWAAALGEAHLLRAVPRTLYRGAFERFRAALHDRLEASKLLAPLPTPDRHLADLGEEPPGLASKSIVCFTPSVDERGLRRLATLAECQLLFELLNRDVSTWLPDLEPSEARLAARPAHIGQPVALRPDHPEAPTVLRLVVGARFFTIVGFPADGDPEAALQGEIADAIGALDKLELLVRHFARLRRNAAESG